MPQPLSEESFPPASCLAHRHELHFDPLVFDLSALGQPMPSPANPPSQAENDPLPRGAKPTADSLAGNAPAAASIYENIFIEDFAADPFFQNR